RCAERSFLGGCRETRRRNPPAAAAVALARTQIPQANRATHETLDGARRRRGTVLGPRAPPGTGAGTTRPRLGREVPRHLSGRLAGNRAGSPRGRVGQPEDPPHRSG